jgi:hypothetical protein
LYGRRKLSQTVLGSFHYVEALSILQGKEQVIGGSVSSLSIRRIDKNWEIWEVG